MYLKSKQLLAWINIYTCLVSELLHPQFSCIVTVTSQIAKFMGPTWGPPGSCRPQMGPMLAPWTLLSGMILHTTNNDDKNSWTDCDVMIWKHYAVLTLWKEKPSVTGGFPSQRANNTESVSMSWHHHLVVSLPSWHWMDNVNVTLWIHFSWSFFYEMSKLNWLISIIWLSTIEIGFSVLDKLMCRNFTFHCLVFFTLMFFENLLEPVYDLGSVLTLRMSQDMTFTMWRSKGQTTWVCCSHSLPHSSVSSRILDFWGLFYELICPFRLGMW